MALQVTQLGEVQNRVTTGLDRLGEVLAGPRVQSDSALSQAFVADHTEFESFAAFCEQSPWALDGHRDIHTVPRDRLDEYVADTTDFDTWEEMKTQAAEEEIIDQVVSVPS